MKLKNNIRVPTHYLNLRHIILNMSVQTYSNGQCIRQMMENYNGMINENDNYRVTVFEQSCSNIFYKN